MTLDYTLSRTMTQQATIQRDQGGHDNLGAPLPPNWQFLAQVPCLLAFAKSEGGRSVNHTYVDTTRDVPIEDGTILFPLGTDITEADRITQITNRATGNVIFAGEITISSTVQQVSHLECGVIRMHLGV
jgi:hypothetical protein